MISSQFKFNKLLTVKDNEKNQIQMEYHEALHQYESVLESLYKYVKQKEDFEKKQRDMLKSGLSIQLIQQQEQWVKNLEKIILHYQTKAMHTKAILQQKQALLREKNIEVKKYQKLKEQHLHSFMYKMNEEERKLMDEISIQQYMNRGN